MIQGHRIPRIRTKPLRDEPWSHENTFGLEAIEFAHDILDLDLTPWQEEFLCAVLEKDITGKRLRFRTALLLVGRQAGKSYIMTVLALYFMTVRFEGSLVIGTAQNLDISSGTWQQAVDLVQSVPEMDELVDYPNQGVIKSPGRQQLKLTNGSTWKIAPATRDGARGKSARLVLLDELLEHKDWDAWNAITPTTASFGESLILGVSSAGDGRSVVLKEQRQKAISKVDDPNTTIAIFEWSTPEEYDIDDPEGWAYSNPSLNNYPSEQNIETLRGLRDSATDVGWKKEHLCQWVTASHDGPWDEGLWGNLADPSSKIDKTRPLVLAVDTSFDRSMTCVVAAGYSIQDPDKVHIEIMKIREGNAWAISWIDGAVDVLGATHVVVQGKGAPATDLIEEIDKLGIDVTPIQGSDVTGSAVKFYDAVRDGHIVHINQEPLTLAAESAQIKVVGDGRFMYDRRKSPVDIAPLVAASLAWYVLTGNAEPPERRSAYENTGLMVV